MGNCCNIRKINNEETNDIDFHQLPKNTNFNNYLEKFSIYKEEIVKIQSCYRGMKFRQKFNKLQSEIINTSYIKSNKITEKDFEEVLKTYPQLNSEKNNTNITIVKNKLIDGKELYYGEYDSERNIKQGRGILIMKNGSKYMGYFKNNKKNIKGKLIHYEGDIYEGEWLDDKANGKGKYTHVDGTTYEGEWKNEKQEGYGIETWNDGSCYKGYYLNGKKNGKGLYKWSDGSSYEGDFKENKINGKGKYIWENKKKYEGDWVNNKMWGNGIFIWPDGRKYKGEYVDDKKEGYGIFSWPDGRIYEGMWKNGFQNGEGELYDPNLKQKRKGLWKHGKVVKWLE